MAPTSADNEPLLIFEFLHRVIDVLEEFLGAPLLASKIEGSYDVVAQLLTEMCDAGSICNTEPNALRDVVEVPGWMGKLLGGVGLPGYVYTFAVRGCLLGQGLIIWWARTPPALGPSMGGLKQQLAISSSSNTGPAIPWRRANVRHTSNELYVDIVETLSVTIAPSGRPLAAFANGSIAFTSKISGVPELLLTLSTPGGKSAIEKALELPVFHPCVRLVRWREKPGELSFVPPDGRFVLAGYEVNLLPSTSDLISHSSANLRLPASIEVKTSLGPTGSDFEVRLLLSNTFSGSISTSSASARGGLGSRGPGTSASTFGGVGGSSSQPVLEDIIVSVPVSDQIRNITDVRTSRGEAQFSPGDNAVEWRISSKDTANGSATLRCTVVGASFSDEDEDDEVSGLRFDAATGDYDETESTYQSGAAVEKEKTTRQQQEQRDQRKVQQNATLMPSSANLSFSVRGWLASGIKVESLLIDTRKSRGLGEGVKPYKGVKYLTVSRKGIETRC